MIFATTNKDKVSELKKILGLSDDEALTLKDIGFDTEVDENGDTFADNALIKAEAVASFILKEKAEFAGHIILADDSGLCIDFYDGAPGIHSHRWLGGRTYRQAMEDIILEMKDVPDEKRGARFACSIAALKYDSLSGKWEKLSVTENCEGIIGRKIEGENGFGYDPFFFVPEYGCTTAVMSPEQKNEISHRGKAARSMCRMMKEAGWLN